MRIGYATVVLVLSVWISGVTPGYAADETPRRPGDELWDCIETLTGPQRYTLTSEYIQVPTPLNEEALRLQRSLLDHVTWKRAVHRQVVEDIFLSARGDPPSTAVRGAMRVRVAMRADVATQQPIYPLRASADAGHTALLRCEGFELIYDLLNGHLNALLAGQSRLMLWDVKSILDPLPAEPLTLAQWRAEDWRELDTFLQDGIRYTVVHAAPAAHPEYALKVVTHADTGLPVSCSASAPGVLRHNWFYYGRGGADLDALWLREVYRLEDQSNYLSIQRVRIGDVTLGVEDSEEVLEVAPQTPLFDHRGTQSTYWSPEESDRWPKEIQALTAIADHARPQVPHRVAEDVSQSGSDAGSSRIPVLAGLAAFVVLLISAWFARAGGRRSAAILLIGFCALASSGCGGEKATSPPPSSVRIQPVDLGELSRGDQVEGQFVVANLGDEDVTIASAIPTCSCIRDLRIDSVVPARGSRIGTFVFDTTHESGQTIRQILLSVGDGIVVPGTVRARVRSRLQITPQRIIRYLLPGDPTAEAVFHVTMPLEDSLDVDRSSHVVQAAIREVHIDRRREVRTHAVELRITLDDDTSMWLGAVTIRVTSAAGSVEAQLPVYVSRAPAVEVQPEHVWVRSGRPSTVHVFAVRPSNGAQTGLPTGRSHPPGSMRVEADGPGWKLTLEESMDSGTLSWVRKGQSYVASKVRAVPTHAPFLLELD